MNNNFFFITSYDNISGTLLSSIINSHPDIDCKISYSDPFLPKEPSQLIDMANISVDQFIQMHSDSDKKFHGSAQRFTAFELQHKTLVERTTQPYRKANILLSPNLRINFLLHSWNQVSPTHEYALALIEQQLQALQSNKHFLFELYIFHYFYNIIINTVLSEKIADLTLAKNKLFVLALAKVITFDSTDIPVPGKNFIFEQLINYDTSFIAFLNYLTNNTLDLPDNFRDGLNSKLLHAKQSIADMEFAPWEEWQSELLYRFTEKRLRTRYYPHIDKPLSTLYTDAGYLKSSFNQQTQSIYSKLISLQLNSNRPAQLAAYFDNIEETADNPSDIEVLVNIDIGNLAMKLLIEKEIPKRKFTLKYIETPRPDSFCDLWKPINNLLEITDPNAYFLLNISDEMFFATQGWDTVLKKYVGFFPDHLFRLRASRNKFRNYFDRWECSFAQDAIPITTKKWIDVGGNWNPCFGPDSFQQLISLYLSKEGIFSNEQNLRDIPIIDIQFSGDVPAIGIDIEKSWKHTSDHLLAMQICQSYPMQLEARRRALLIKANMIASAEQLTNFNIVTIEKKKEIHLINNETKFIIAKLDYSVSWFGINFINQWRKLYFYSYFGGGINTKISAIRSFSEYLKNKNRFIYKSYLLLVQLRNNRKESARTIARKTIGKLLRKITRQIDTSSILIQENYYLKEEYNKIRVENENLRALLLEQKLLANHNEIDYFDEMQATG